MKLFLKTEDNHLYIAHMRYKLPQQDYKERWDTTYAARPKEGGTNEFLDRESRASDVRTFIKDHIVEKFGDRKDIKILDLGCGVGGHAFTLLEEGYDVHMSDFSSTLVNDYLKPKLKAEGHSEDRAFEGDARNMSSLESQYDLIFMVGVVPEFRDTSIPSEIYNEIHTKLNDDGLFIQVLGAYCNAEHQKYQNWVVRTLYNSISTLKDLPNIILQPIKSSNLVRKIFGKQAIEGASGFHLVFSYFLYQPVHIASRIEAAGFAVTDTQDLDILSNGGGQANYQRFGIVAKKV
ncbi:MAG: class I SAM-dependent methyltransferase [Magnetovibrio sp.]|nr:class I SAM-dependent methyltransferase [Magnetovibrio sp.]